MLVWRCGKHLCWMRYLLYSALCMTEPKGQFFGKKKEKKVKWCFCILNFILDTFYNGNHISKEHASLTR